MTLPPLTTPRLSPREIEILTLAKTMKQAEIAERLGVTGHTVKKTIQNARAKYVDWRFRAGMIA